jgi:hypothetical protein
MKKSLVLIAMVAMATQIKAADGGEQFLQLSLTPEIALHSKDTTIKGLSLNIWGENPQHGVALGFVHGSTGESSGFSWGLVNYTESYTGVQWSFFNYSTGDFSGWQAAAVNYSGGTFVGFQSGWVNYAKDLKGLQMGFVNYAETLNHGVQIGFANIAMNNGWFDEFPDKLAKGFPFVNWSF